MMMRPLKSLMTEDLVKRWNLLKKVKVKVAMFLILVICNLFIYEYLDPLPIFVELYFFLCMRSWQLSQVSYRDCTIQDFFSLGVR